MNDNQQQTAIATTPDPSDAPAEWGSREEVNALALRLQKMLPGNLNHIDSLALAQYSIALDANPYRGEVYAFEHFGKLVLVDGYKLLVRWANQQCPYSESYEPLADEELPEDSSIGFRCWILRSDQKQTIPLLIQAGATFREAFEIAATSAIGIVTKADRTTSKGLPMDPPKGWNWQAVARKRALKNALNRSHGAPSPREIAHASWTVDETETIAADWETCTPEMSSDKRARLAKMAAQERQREPDPREPEEVLAENGELLHGNGEGEI